MTQVQNQRLPNANDPTSYADDFTVEAVNLLDDILRRPVPWVGIRGEEKNRKLTDVQYQVDALAQSLTEFSEAESHDYVSINQGKGKLINSGHPGPGRPKG